MDKDSHLIFEKYKVNEGLKDMVAAGALGLASMANPGSNVQAAPQAAVQNVQDAKEEFKKEVRQNEGKRNKAYPDPVHGWKVPTVGYGFNLNEGHVLKALKKAGVDTRDIRRVYMNDQQMEQALDTLVDTAINDARNLFVGYDALPFVPKKIITDMSYNLGGNKLAKFQKMRAAIAKQDYNAAADEMMDSMWYKQTTGRGKRLVQDMRDFANQGTRDANEKMIIIKQGDTLGKIARDHKINLQQLLKVNPQIKNPNQISIGQKIKLP